MEGSGDTNIDAGGGDENPPDYNDYGPPIYDQIDNSEYIFRILTRCKNFRLLFESLSFVGCITFTVSNNGLKLSSGSHDIDMPNDLFTEVIYSHSTPEYSFSVNVLAAYNAIKWCGNDILEISIKKKDKDLFCLKTENIAKRSMQYCEINTIAPPDY